MLQLLHMIASCLLVRFPNDDNSTHQHLDAPLRTCISLYTEYQVTKTNNASYAHNGLHACMAASQGDEDASLDTTRYDAGYFMRKPNK